MIESAPTAPSEDSHGAGGSRFGEMFGRPPGWLMAGLAAVLAVVILWLLSYPGGSITMAVFSGLALVALGIVWLVRTMAFLRARSDGARGALWRLGIVPVILLVVLLLAITSTPQKLRFGMAEDDFMAQVEAKPADCPATQPTQFEVPDRIGSFDIDRAMCQGDAVVFFVPGGFFSNVGFAYLPTGSFPELETGDLDGVEFTALSGDWYTFTTG